MTLTNVLPRTFDYFSILNHSNLSDSSLNMPASENPNFHDLEFHTPEFHTPKFHTPELTEPAFNEPVFNQSTLNTSENASEFTSPPFNPSQLSNVHRTGDRYCSAKALALGHMADLSYCSRRLVEATLINDWGFHFVEFFPLGPTNAFLVADDEKIIVAFRGSDDPKDWLHNLKLDLVDGPAQGEVHRGFLKMLGDVWQALQYSICRLRAQARWQGQELALWFTGHSLGGALATLAVAQLREAGEAIDGLYTFASPRVGDRTFAHNFNVDFGFKTFRIVNQNDLVPQLPLRFLRYHHVGQLHYFDRTGQRHHNSTALFRLLDALKIHANDLFDLDFSAAENHDIGPYLGMLYRDYHSEFRAPHRRLNERAEQRLRQDKIQPAWIQP